jgi:hypothetical protein
MAKGWMPPGFEMVDQKGKLIGGVPTSDSMAISKGEGLKSVEQSDVRSASSTEKPRAPEVTTSSALGRRLRRRQQAAMLEDFQRVPDKANFSTVMASIYQ